MSALCSILLIGLFSLCVGSIIGYTIVFRLYTTSCADTNSANQGMPCQNLNCSNGGTCVLKDDEPLCMCMSGFNGSQCEDIICECKLHDDQCSDEGCALLISAEPLCLYQKYGDDFDWIQHYGETPSSSTGPSAAKVGTFYHYFDSGGLNRGESAVLVSQKIDIDENSCLKFWYSMYGSSVGRFKLFLDDDLIWEQVGNKGPAWILAEVDLQSNSTSPVQIKFEAVADGSSKGDIAIDGVELIQTGC